MALCLQLLVSLQWLWCAGAARKEKSGWGWPIFSGSPAPAVQQKTIIEPRIDATNNPNHKWQGWGVSLAWWGNAYGKSNHADALADAVFTNQDFVALETASGTKLNLPGLNMNVVRYNAGGSSDLPMADKSTMIRGTGYMKPENENRIIKGFWQNSVDSQGKYDETTEDSKTNNWNWTADSSQTAMLLKAKQRGANLFELFSNSPMWWMLRSKNTAGLEPRVENLPPENYGKFAHYLTEVWKHAKDSWGVTFQTIEPFNEPTAIFWSKDNHQEGCFFSEESQDKVIRELSKVMKTKQINAEIAASDENTLAGDSTSPQAKLSGAFKKALHSWKYFKEQNTAPLIAQANVHGYGWLYWNMRKFAGGTELDDGQWTNKDSIFVRDEFRKLTEGKRLWLSEYGRGSVQFNVNAQNLAQNLADGIGLGGLGGLLSHAPSPIAAGMAAVGAGMAAVGRDTYGWDTGDWNGLHLARTMILDLKWLQPSVWCLWQIVDRDTTWGLLKGDLVTATFESVNAGWFVFAQFSRHIRPGMTMLTTIKPGADASQTDPALDDMTIIAKDDKHIVVVVGPSWEEKWDAKIGQNERQLEFRFGSLGKVGSSAQQWCTTAEPNEDQKDYQRGTNTWRANKYQKKNDVPLQGSNLSIVLPRYSVCTYEIDLLP